MVSSLNSSFQGSSLRNLPSNSTFQYPKKTQSRICIGFTKSSNFSTNIYSSSSSSSSSSRLAQQILQKCCAPLAVSLVLLWSNPAEAGFLSGLKGIESVPGPELPKIEFLDRFNEENQKKYAENDERIRSSPLIQEFLERSKRNKEKNKQEILDKYCIRGAEWGVGDCSTEGMTAEEKENFIAMLKQKAGVK
ncbi:hypothetical protein Cgig2_031314 [Carnegiea gigantea]|uniref:Uncharacterized protein n=1 Tax=Carnegiea gigantea TaxID=171969 RepID=A0A9Q1QL17_9CARY|nr:hypothetical protein Cgig2_031314 [Carnegiea gigantea]